MFVVKLLLKLYIAGHSIPTSEQLDEPSPTSETIEKAAQVAGTISIVYVYTHATHTLM